MSLKGGNRALDHMERVELRDKVEAHLKARLANNGVKPGSRSRKGMEMEMEFLMGACAAINALYPNENPEHMSAMVPNTWLILPMCGRSIFAKMDKESA